SAPSPTPDLDDRLPVAPLDRFRLRTLRCATVGWLAAFALDALAFVPSAATPEASRWATTSLGSTGTPGRPVRLTWSIAPDGTQTVNPSAGNTFTGSNLVASLDATFGAGPGGSNYTLRPWFTHLNQSFERWEALAGVTYTYEPADDGARHSTQPGVAGLRGDVRVAGIAIDGAAGTLAYNYFPPDGGDMAFDTGDLGTFADPSNNYRAFRNVTMHEAGHGLGIEHTSSSDAAFLMEPAIDLTFDGPQHDDLRGVHWLCGDVLEKSNGGLGNESASLATALGPLSLGATLSIGAGGAGTVVGPAETDFVSIANASDADFFSFTVDGPRRISATMTPRGATFQQTTTTFNTTTTSNLGLALLGPGGSTLLADASAAPAGQAESIANVDLPSAGTYFLRVSGVGTVTQFYSLALSAVGMALPGDYNGDGLVNAADYSRWRDTLGATVSPFTAADGDGDGSVGQSDYAVWVANYGRSSATAIPEPLSMALAALSMIFVAPLGRRRRIVPRHLPSPWQPFTS
ncbi:MAG: matrixin family metalloprotease, partial [Lacipirellulaceae bacterium]